MSKKPKDINVTFYRALMLEKGSKRQAETLDWPAVLSTVAKMTLAELTNDDIIYDVLPERELPIVGVHRVLNTDFMTSIDYATKTITDLMEDAETDERAKRFAHTTAMAFLPEGNVVAIASTSTNSPRAPKVLTDFLTHALPQPAGAHWMADPLLEPNKVAQLKQAKGVERFEARIDSVKEIFDVDGDYGIASYADELAERLGGDVIIDLSIRLAPHSKASVPARRFLETVVSTLTRVDHRKKATAKAVLPDGATEELNLVASRFAATMPVMVDTSERMRYSALLDGLESVSVEMKTRVSELLRG